MVQLLCRMEEDMSLSAPCKFSPSQERLEGNTWTEEAKRQNSRTSRKRSVSGHQVQWERRGQV